jgi:glucokinase
VAARDTALLGVEIGGTKLQVVLGTASGRVLCRWLGTVAPERGGAGICDQLRDAVREMITEAQPVAVGAGFGGPIDWHTGRVCKSHQIDGWEGFELGAFLGNLAHAPAFVDNDANVAALGEAVVGAGRGATPVFYITLGSGVGGGLVIDQTIYHGAPPGEAEFGHLWLDRDGATVEARCAGWAVDRRVRAGIEADPHGPLAQLVASETRGEARHLAAALRQHDPMAGAILASLAEDLGFALSHVAHLLHPAVIVLGGGLSLIGEPLLAAVTNALGNRIMAAFAPGPEVKLAELAQDAVPVGALILAAQRQAIANG